MSELSSIKRILEAARFRGLKITQLRTDDYMMQCPIHEPDNTPSVHVTYRPGDGRTVICDQHDSTDRHLTVDILQALGLGWTDLYDNPLGRDAARNRHERMRTTPSAADLREIAEANARTARATESPAPGMSRSHRRFPLPDPIVAEDERGTLSERFLAICDLLETTPTHGTFQTACPACGEADALRVLYVPLQRAALLRCRSCGGANAYADMLVLLLSLDAACVCSNGSQVMIYDDPQGVTYEYGDRLSVSRSPAKHIRQHGTTKGQHPLWLADRVKPYAQDGNQVFLVEGEKDASTLWACGYPATTAPGGGGSLASTLDPGNAEDTLADADVIAVVDKDATGDKWRSQVETLLRPVVKSLTFIRACGDAHDATDAVMMEREFESLPDGMPSNTTNTQAPKSSASAKSDSYVLVNLADVQPEKVDWLWPGHIPRGKIVMIDGDPSTGKSTLALDIAAHITTGAAWPDGSKGCEPANVLLLTAEDGLADTVSPRVRAADGDASRVLVLTNVLRDGKEIAMTLTDAMSQIRQIVERHRIGLIVIDVLMSFLGSDTNSYRDQDMRAQVMAPLKRLCEDNGCTVIALRHLNKGQGAAIYRGGGSIGIIGAARAAFLVAKDQDDEELRVFAPVKFNLGPMPKALAYRLADAPEYGCARINWEGETEQTADDLTTPAPENPEMNDAQSFVVDCWRTHGEPMPDGSGHGIRSEEVIERGKGEFNAQQLKDARRRCRSPRFLSRKIGTKWWWYAPDEDDGPASATAIAADTGTRDAEAVDVTPAPAFADEDGSWSRAIMPPSPPSSDCGDPWTIPGTATATFAPPSTESTDCNGSQPGEAPRWQDGNGHVRTSVPYASADAEAMFDELPTYPTEVDLTAMPASLLRLIRSRKHGLWSNKASAELARREADERGMEQAA